MKKYEFSILLIVVLSLFASGCAHQIEPAPLIKRHVFFGNPDKIALKVSPGGDKISYLAPLDGVMNVWVAPATDPDHAVVVTHDQHRGIHQYFWAYTNDHILYLQDQDGDESWQIHAVDVNTKKNKNLTPVETIIGPDGKPITLPSGKKLRPRARIIKVSQKFNTEILIGINQRNPRYHDVYRLNILTGDMMLVQKNDEFTQFIADEDYILRYAVKMTPEGGKEILEPVGNSRWQSADTIAQEDVLTTGFISFDKTGQNAYMLDSRGRDTAALTIVDLKTAEKKVVLEDPRVDLSAPMIHPTDKTLQAVASYYTRLEWKILDRSIQTDFDYLETVSRGDMFVVSRSLDDHLWVIAYTLDKGPVSYYLYDRSKKNARFMFTSRKDLEGLALSPMNPVVIPARDGLNLVSYLTLPPGSDSDADAHPDKPLPMVLLVHGGPWGRDAWGYHPIHQWLANRGYAVLSVNFRGSAGFGKDFINAGNLQWGAKMHDDLIDAVNWAIDQGLADKEKIAIMGGSYGGYATLVGLTFTPDVFACGVDIVGPSNLKTLLETIPPDWTPLISLWTTRVGDPRTEEGRKFLASRSPLTFAGRIKKPLLIGQGANDPRVKQSESDQIVNAMRKNNLPVTYVLFPDEGHGFRRPENSLAFFAVTENFLAQHLGGRAEPVGDDFSGSSITFPGGADAVPAMKSE